MNGTSVVLFKYQTGRDGREARVRARSLENKKIVGRGVIHFHTLIQFERLSRAVTKRLRMPARGTEFMMSAGGKIPFGAHHVGDKVRTEPGARFWNQDQVQCKIRDRKR